MAANLAAKRGAGRVAESPAGRMRQAAARTFSFGPPEEPLSASGLDASTDADDVSGPIVDAAVEA